MIENRDGVSFELRAYSDLPGLRSVLIDADERLWCAVKETYSVALIHRGRSEVWSGRRVVASGPGTILLNEPESVHKDLRREGRARFQIVNFDAQLVRDHAERRGVALRASVLERSHPDRRALLALHRVFRESPDMLTRQVVVAESLDALVRQLDGGKALPRANVSQARLRRAVEYIHEHLGDVLTLDALAAAADLDRFHLCRAFREEYGLPPYAYALRARIARACRLLASGTPVSDVASALGFCDQSQLHRHFRRALGVPPGAYARMARKSS